MNAEQPQAPAGDKFDAMCSCALIGMMPSDEDRFARMSIAAQQAWKRGVVNTGARPVIPDADCVKCKGSGTIPA
jgi:hypothetical protein